VFLSRNRDSAIALILGAALAAISFGAAGGSELSRTSITEVLMLLAGAGVIAAALLWGRGGPLDGATSLIAFAALAALTALSVLWSIVPELSYIEAGRTLSYLVVFAAAIAGARLAPRAVPGVIGGVLLGAMLPVAYSLASRIWPGSLAENELSNRIGAPFQYWNAVGTVAAISIPLALWLGSRRTGHVWLRALAYPAVGMSVLAILLTQSRGALAAAAGAAVLWLAIVPLRLRSLPIVIVPSLAAGAVGAWALSKDAFSKSLQPLEAKEAVAGDFGLLVVLMTLLLFAAGLAVNLGLGRRLVSMRARRRAGLVALAVACVIPLAAFTSVALSGTIDDRVSELTSETDVAPDEGGDRVFASSSTRGKYWREAGRVFDDRPAVGVGAGAFAVARLRHRTDAANTAHAHGFVPQTLADLGVVGVAVTTVLLIAWLVAALRAAALLPRRLPYSLPSLEPGPRRDWDSDRMGLVALTLAAIAFGLQSIIDWTWFIPGPAVLALVAAGYVAGRGPLTALPEARPPQLRPSPGRIAAAVGVGVAAVVLAWAVWQPEASDRATGEALELADARDFPEAIAKTQDAEDLNPLSAEPLLVRASIETQAGDTAAAQDTLEQAVLKFPGDPHTWYRLAAFQLGTQDQPAAALETLQGALYLDPFWNTARTLFLEARARQRELETVQSQQGQRDQEPELP
jgi:O-Antigen ligase